METQRKVTELQVTVGGAGDTAGTRTWSLCWKHGHRHCERRAHCCSWNPGSAAAWVHSYNTYKKKVCKVVVAVHAFNLSTWEAEAGRFLSLRLAWSTE